MSDFNPFAQPRILTPEFAWRTGGELVSVLIAELELRWRAIFEALAGGSDVPPAMRLRAEGLMEAAVLTGAATAQDLVLAMAGIYQQVYGQSLEQDFGENWNDFSPFPQIPAMGKRAPVYPSTSD